MPILFDFCKTDLTKLQIKHQITIFYCLKSVPFQVPSKSLPKSVQIPFFAYSMKGIRSELQAKEKRRRSEPEEELKKNKRRGAEEPRG